MVKITGTLHSNTGFIRIKPNINFIGSVQGTKIYNLSEPLELELPPTPAEGVYLIDYTSDTTEPFVPSEHWIIPNEDCTFDDIRGVKKLDDYLTKLETENANLRTENLKLLDTNQEYQEIIKKLQEQLNLLNKEETETKVSTFLNILNRF